MCYLSSVEGLIGWVVVVEQEHVDEGDEEAGGISGGLGVVGQPLVEDEQRQVAKEAAHEDDLRDEAQVDVQRLLEVATNKREQRGRKGEVVRQTDRQTDRKQERKEIKRRMRENGKRIGRPMVKRKVNREI